MSQNIVLTESTYYILLALHKPQHGYGIMQQVESLSDGRVHLAAGTLYGALNVLCEKEWITPPAVPSVKVKAADSPIILPTDNKTPEYIPYLA